MWIVAKKHFILGINKQMHIKLYIISQDIPILYNICIYDKLLNISM